MTASQQGLQLGYCVAVRCILLLQFADREKIVCQRVDVIRQSRPLPCPVLVETEKCPGSLYEVLKRLMSR